MDVLEILSQEHKLVVNLLQRGDQGDDAAQGQVIKQIVQELLAHEQAEEAAVYPQLRKLIPDLKAVEKAIQQQSELKQLLEQAGPKIDPDKLVGQFEAITKQILGHIALEENEIFPLVEQQIDTATRQRLGEAYQAAKAHQVEAMAKLNVTMMPESESGVKQQQQR